MTRLERLRRRWARRPLAAASRSSRSGAIYWGLLAAALAVRLVAARDAYFADDESLLWAQGFDVARGLAFPQVGPPISGTPAGLPGPLLYWVTALPLLLFRHPLAASAFYALLSVLGVGLFARQLRAHWGRAAQLCFQGIAVASPWMVLYADRPWAGNLFFFLCAVALWASLKLVREPRARLPSFALALLLVAGPQLHLSTVHLAALSAVILLVGRARPSWRWGFAGGLLGAALYAPYLVHEVRTGFSNTRQMLIYAPGPPWSKEGVVNLLSFFVGFNTTDVSYFVERGYWGMFDPLTFWRAGGAAQMGGFFESTGAGWACWGLLALSAAAALAGVGLIVVRLVRRRHRDLLAVAFLAAVVDVVLLHVLSGKYGYPHYLTIVAPLGFLPLVASLGALARLKPGPWLAAAALVAFTAVSALELRAYYRTVEGTAVEQLAIVEKVFETSPPGTPWSLSFGLRWAFAPAYERLAQRMFDRPWAPTGGGPQWVVVAASDLDRLTGAPQVTVVLRMRHLALVRLRADRADAE